MVRVYGLVHTGPSVTFPQHLPNFCKGWSLTRAQTCCEWEEDPYNPAESDRYLEKAFHCPGADKHV